MTNEKTTPERIWISPVVTSDDWPVWSNFNSWRDGVEYVRADLLTAARKEEREAAFSETVEIVRRMAWTTTHDRIITALEAAASTKGANDVR